MGKILQILALAIALLAMDPMSGYAQRPNGSHGNKHTNGGRKENMTTPRPSTNNNSGRPATGNNHVRPSAGHGNNNNHRPAANQRPDVNHRPAASHRPSVNQRPSVIHRPSVNHRPGVSHRPTISNRPGHHVVRPPMVVPPHRPYRPVIARPHFRPTPPPAWRPRRGLPVIRGILGLTFGAAFSVSLDYLYSSGYTVDGYDNNIVYLRNVPAMNYIWTDGALYYGNDGLDASSFYYSTPNYDLTRYNSVYNSLVNVYGGPVSVNNTGGTLTSTWFGGNNGYITLSFGAGTTGRFLTTLTLGL